MRRHWSTHKREVQVVDVTGAVSLRRGETSKSSVVIGPFWEAVVSLMLSVFRVY